VDFSRNNFSLRKIIDILTVTNYRKKTTRKEKITNFCEAFLKITQAKKSPQIIENHTVKQRNKCGYTHCPSNCR